MYFKLTFLYIFNVIPVNSFELLAINDGYRGLVQQINFIAIQQRTNVIEQWIEQKLDHFNKSDTRTWKMRYYKNLQFWKTNGPVYLIIDGESPAAPNFFASGIIYELALETEGAVYISEHRYYGKSQPVNRSHFNVEDFKFLKARQALADNAELLKSIKSNTLYKDSKVVVIGGSYAGNLAAWMRLTYPDLVDAVISSSGPVLAKRDFYEYAEVVSNDYKKYGTPGCLEFIKKTFQRFDLLFQSDSGIRQLKQEHKICENIDMNKTENRQLFFIAKTNDFKIVAQYSTPNRIKTHCLEIKNSKILFDDKKYFWDNEKGCYEYDFDQMVQQYYERKNDDILCWTYQSCAEFGYFQTTTSNDQPFTKNIPVEWYDKLCMAVFGLDFDKDRINKGVKEVNEMFGAKSPNITKVVFVNGELDPWSSLGVLKDISSDTPAIVIPRSSHCKDLFDNLDYDEDNEELLYARFRIKDTIKRWIGVDDFPSVN